MLLNEISLKYKILLADTGRGKRQASDLHIVSMLGRYSFTIPETVALWELRPPLDLDF
jgi:hypothetical protein